MSLGRFTPWFMLAVLALIVAYDIVALVRGGYQATISARTVGFVYRNPSVGVLVGLAAGVVIGHLFWPQPDPRLCP